MGYHYHWINNWNTSDDKVSRPCSRLIFLDRSVWVHAIPATLRVLSLINWCRQQIAVHVQGLLTLQATIQMTRSLQNVRLRRLVGASPKTWHLSILGLSHSINKLQKVLRQKSWVHLKFWRSLICMKASQPSRCVVVGEKSFENDMKCRMCTVIWKLHIHIIDINNLLGDVNTTLDKGYALVVVWFVSK